TKEFDGDAVIVRLELGLDGRENFLFDGAEFRAAGIGGNQVRERMLANDGALGGADQGAELLLHGGNSTRKFLQKHARLSDAPADIDRGQQREAVRRQILAELVLEVGALDAL